MAARFLTDHQIGRAMIELYQNGLPVILPNLRQLYDASISPQRFERCLDMWFANGKPRYRTVEERPTVPDPKPDEVRETARKIKEENLRWLQDHHRKVAERRYIRVHLRQTRRRRWAAELRKRIDHKTIKESLSAYLAHATNTRSTPV